MLVEHKSKGKDLDKAFTQAKDYFPGLPERDLPRYVLVSDFARFRLYDFDGGKTHTFSLKELYKNIRLFGFIAGYQTRSFGVEDPVNIKAAEELGKLHDLLEQSLYKGHEVMATRVSPLPNNLSPFPGRGGTPAAQTIGPMGRNLLALAPTYTLKCVPTKSR